MSINGYYDLGLKALSAARLGIQIAGNNIANVNTPGFARRRLELASGYPVPVTGGYLDRGVDVSRVGRAADQFLQLSLQREKGTLSGSREQLRGLGDLEVIYGELDGQGVLPAFDSFLDSFAQLAGNATSEPLREGAISAADVLAGRIRSTYDRLQDQRRSENNSISAVVDEINGLARSLADLNVEIVSLEAGGDVAGSLRDRRDQVVEQLSELTGGTAYRGEQGQVQFAFSGGPTLVTTERALPIETTKDADGLIQVSIGGADFTGRVREGNLGALLGLRDDQITGQLEDLDQVARFLIIRTNQVTSSSFDLQGNPGGPLFDPDPPPATGAAKLISVSATVADDPKKLAVSATGETGDSTGALAISNLRDLEVAALGRRTIGGFLADSIAGLGNKIAITDVAVTTSEGMLENLEQRRESISGVSLDEEAVELLRHQQAFEAAARFMDVLNQVTEITMTLGR